MFDPSVDHGKQENTTVDELYQDEMHVLQYNSELFNDRQDSMEDIIMKKQTVQIPQSKANPNLKLTLPRKRESTPEMTTF